MPKPQTFAEFWPEYLDAHRAPATRLMHYVGSSLAVACVLVAAATLDWRWLVAAPLAGYAFAWLAHLAIEHNNPKTFEHPLWSLIGDYRMLGLWLARRLQTHLVRT